MELFSKTDLLDSYAGGDDSAGEELSKMYEGVKTASSRVTEEEYIPTKMYTETPFKKDNPSARSVYDFMNEQVGTDWWEDELETIYKVLWLDYGVVLDDIKADKLCAIRHLCRNDAAFFDWFEFNQIALSFGGAKADFEYLRKPSPGMIINAVHTMNHIRPDKKADFSKDVKKSICINFINDGIVVPPPTIALLIAREMRELTKRETSSMWAEVGNKFKSLQENPVEDETASGVQARRLIVAEKAAENYFA